MKTLNRHCNTRDNYTHPPTINYPTVPLNIPQTCSTKHLIFFFVLVSLAMENEAKRGKQKIEMKLIESEKARAVSFSKRKNTLFQQANKLAAMSGADVGVLLFSPSGKPCSNGSTSIEEIIDKYFKVKLRGKPTCLC
uniref:Putative ovule protein n=1 Tax=Solanum chacoense TaxID=4108 RepID=A0A0V0I333_SOLCH